MAGSPDRRPGVHDDAPSVFPGFDSMAGDVIELIDHLVAVRRRRGLSQTEVAARMGTSQSALARVEAAQSDVRVSTIVRYAAALGVDVSFSVRSGREGDRDDR
jgi:ribosome-binding protein aMBF1 (putative translation factor)